MSADRTRPLADRVCIVTGAGQGVGRAIALQFAERGAAAVVVNDYFEERAEAVAAEIRSLGGNAVGAQADVTDFDAMEAMIKGATDRFGHVDILVNNAGNYGPRADAVSTTDMFWDASRSDWEAWIRVNLFGVLNGAYAALPAMIEQKFGRIVTIISDAGRVGQPGMSVYAAAKAGAAGFMRSLAREAAPHGITCNNVVIGMTRTPAVTVDPEMERKFVRAYPVGRIGEPEDVANLVSFLASDESSFITGQTYPVNGGFSFTL